MTTFIQRCSLVLAIVALAFGAVVSPTMAQINPSLKVSLYVPSHPDPVIANWATENSVLIATITNTSAKVIDARFDCQVYKGTTLQASTKSASMMTIHIQPGASQWQARDIIPMNAVSFQNNVNTTAAKTGMLPGGDDYSVCVALLDDKTLKPISVPVCKSFTLTTYQAPFLELPLDKSVLGAQGERPKLQWSALVPHYTSLAGGPNNGTLVTYRVEALQVLPGQTPTIAFQVNQPLVDVKTSMTQLLWPAGYALPQPGEQWVWSVQAQNAAGDPIVTANNGWAAPFTFSACCDGVSKEDGGPPRLSGDKPFVPDSTRSVNVNPFVPDSTRSVNVNPFVPDSTRRSIQSTPNGIVGNGVDQAPVTIELISPNDGLAEQISETNSSNIQIFVPSTDDATRSITMIPTSTLNICCDGSDVPIAWQTNMPTGPSPNYNWSISGIPGVSPSSGNYPSADPMNAGEPIHSETLALAPCTPGNYCCTLTITRSGTPTTTESVSFPVHIYSQTFSAVICAKPLVSGNGDGSKGCRKTFTVSNACPPIGGGCPYNADPPPFPPDCQTKYHYMIYLEHLKTPVQVAASYPAPSAISGLTDYEATTCTPVMNINTWYPFPNDGNNIHNRTATLPDNLPIITSLGDRYYVICYVENSPTCCTASGYAGTTASNPSFWIFAPQTTSTPIVAYVCSPETPQTDYHRCCEKKFVLNSNIAGTTANISVPGAVYHWVIQSSTSTISPPRPNCLAEVVQGYTFPGDCATAINPQGGWFPFGTSSNTQLAPKLGYFPGFYYYVSCYIQVPCEPTLPCSCSSGWAIPQRFQVWMPAAPIPVITATDPSLCSTTTTNAAGISTLTICSLPAPNITLTASGCPAGTVYTWHPGLGTGTTYPGNLTTVGTHTIYVTSSTGGLYNLPNCPNCIDTSKKFTVIVKDCPCIAHTHPGTWARGPGTYSFTIGRTGTVLTNGKEPDITGCPGESFDIKIEVWGAGGGGKGGDDPPGGSLGGEGGHGSGGGGYGSTGIAVVIPPCGVRTYAVQVGAGGLPGANSSSQGDPSNDGGFTEVKFGNTSIVKATGGIGHSYSTSGTPYPGGTGTLNNLAGAAGSLGTGPDCNCSNVGACGGVGGLGGAGGGSGGNNGGNGGHGAYNYSWPWRTCEKQTTFQTPGSPGGNGSVKITWF